MESRRGPGPLSVLDVDPDLAAGLTPAQLELARRSAIAATTAIDPPRWDVTDARTLANSAWLGLLVVNGLMLRCVTIGRRTSCELLGPGDVVRPWDVDGDYGELGIDVSWRILLPTRVSVLSEPFARRISRWPSINAQIVARVARRARYLALIQTVTHLPRVHARLLMLFWLLSERWGRVGTAGVRVTLPLTHEVLAMLVGAQRPSVTVALRRLSKAGLLERSGHDQWLLTHRAIERVGRDEPIEIRLLESARDGHPSERVDTPSERVDTPSEAVGQATA